MPCRAAAASHCTASCRGVLPPHYAVLRVRRLVGTAVCLHVFRTSQDFRRKHVCANPSEMQKKLITNGCTHARVRECLWPKQNMPPWHLSGVCGMLVERTWQEYGSWCVTRHGSLLLACVLACVRGSLVGTNGSYVIINNTLWKPKCHNNGACSETADEIRESK